MRLKALDRLVIVDACQAESILQDPAGRRDPEVDGTGARARPGPLTSWPPAAASPRSRSTRSVTGSSRTPCSTPWERSRAGTSPRRSRSSASPPTPISTHDGILSITELDAYVSQNLKAIARVFPEIVVKREADLPVGKPRVPAAKLEQHPVLQSFGSSFPLVPLAPRKPEGNP